MKSKLNWQTLLACLLAPFGACQAKALPAPTSTEVSLLAPMLNSERIQYRFGSYGVEPLNACADIFPENRISNLYSLQAQQKVMRTLAIVEFAHPMPAALLSVHQQIQAGASIGSTLQKNGWTINKQPIYFGEIPLSRSIRNSMQDEGHDNAALFMYTLNVKEPSKPQTLLYCTITEIYSPQFLTLPWLKAIYPDSFMRFNQPDTSFQVKFDEIQQCMETIEPF